MPWVAGLIVKPREAGASARLSGLAEAQGATNEAAEGAAKEATESAAEEAAGHARRALRVRTAIGRLGADGWRVVAPVGRLGQRVDFEAPVDEASAEARAERLRASGEFEWVVLNRYERRQQVFPSDPLFSAAGTDGQWWLRQVPTAVGYRGVPDITTAWGRLLGSSTPVIAVLDTGITSHPDLGPAVRSGGFDLVGNNSFSADGQNGREGDPSDPGDALSAAELARAPFNAEPSCIEEPSSWHGTIITGLIGATTNNGIGVAGLNQFARVLPVRVAGKCGALQSDLIDGMRWAAGLRVSGLAVNPQPARVINISFGSANACDAAYQAAIDELAVQKGAVVVAAAGNESTGTRGPVIRPANCRGVVAVAAVHADGFKADYSSFGPEVTVSTVGGDSGGRIVGDGGLVTVNNEGRTTPGASGYAAHYGTSFAAPVVAGTVSLMLGLNPDLSPAQVLDGLKRSARPHASRIVLGSCSESNAGQCNCSTATCGAGLLDAPGALAYASTTAGSFRPPGGGGGVSGAPWLAALAAAVWALRRGWGPSGTGA